VELQTAGPRAMRQEIDLHLVREQIKDEDAQLVVQHERLLDELVRAGGHVVLRLRAQRHHCVVLLPPSLAADLHAAGSNATCWCESVCPMRFRRLCAISVDNYHD
jgi:hypothetical protein